MIPPEIALEAEPEIPVCNDCGLLGAYIITETDAVICEACSDKYEDRSDHRHDPEGWRITGLETAEWAMAKYVAAEAEWQAIEEQGRVWKSRINAWEAEQQKAPLRTRDFMAERLAEYLQELRDADPDTKNLKLPSGGVFSRKGRGKLNVTDEPALIGFLRAYADEMEEPVENYLAVKVSPKLDALRAILSPEGLEQGVAAVDAGDSIVPGVEAVPPAVGYTIKPA